MLLFGQIAASPFNVDEVLLRMLLSMLAGGLLGLERTRKLRPAGLRTYMLISSGACLVMMTGLYSNLVLGLGNDPARMAAQVISGIGFIGAGTIMITRFYRVKGLTTAAGLWAAACLGLVIGIGFYVAAAAGFAVVAFTLWFADDIEKAFTSRMPNMQAHLMVHDMDAIKCVADATRAMSITISEIEIIPVQNDIGISLYCVLQLPRGTDHGEVMKKLDLIDGVYVAEEIIH